MTTEILRRTLLAVSVVLLAACGSRLNLENYNRIKLGQSFEEVKKLIGDPARCDEVLGVRNCVWGDEKQGASVSFMADKAILLSASNLK